MAYVFFFFPSFYFKILFGKDYFRLDTSRLYTYFWSISNILSLKGKDFKIYPKS